MRPIEDADLDEHLLHQLRSLVSRPRYGRNYLEKKESLNSKTLRDRADAMGQVSHDRA